MRLLLLDNGEADQANIQKAVAAFTTGSGGSVSLENGDDDDDDDEYEDLDGLMNINSEIAIEKEISAEVIGQVFEATRHAFMPYLEDSINALMRLLLHYYEGIRKGALSSLFTIIRTFYEMSDPVEWEHSVSLKQAYSQSRRKANDRILLGYPRAFPRSGCPGGRHDHASCHGVVGDGRRSVRIV